MDKTSIIGLIVGLAAVLGGAMMDGTPIQSLLNLPAFVIVIVGTLGATALSYPTGEFVRLPSLFKRVFFEQTHDRIELVETFVQLATKARRDGLLSLESQIEKVHDKFLLRGIQLVIDGTDEAVIRQVLEADMNAAYDRHHGGYAIFDTMGGFSPTLGIMGAVLGLIHVLSQVADPSKLAAGIAVAFVATLYGVGMANLVFLPMGSKLRVQAEEEEALRGLMMRGILAINAGDNPRIVRQKLDSFLAPKKRGGANAKAEASAGAPAAPAVPAAARR